MCVNESISFSSTILVGSIGVVTDFRMSSALNGVSFQLGNNSVNSGPKPRSISSKLYSQFDDVGDTLVGDGGAGVIPVYITDEIDGVEDDVVMPKLVDVDEDDDADNDADEAVVAGTTEANVHEVVDVEKRSLLFNGSSADCEDRLSTLPQLMGLVTSSSPYPESVSGKHESGNGVARPD